MEKQENLAFIDGQNLYMGTAKLEQNPLSRVCTYENWPEKRKGLLR